MKDKIRTAGATKRTKRPRARRGRHEGSVFQRASDGLWVGTVSFGQDADGKRIRRTLYGDSKQAVLEAMAELRSMPKPTSATSSKITLAQFQPQWLQAMEVADHPRASTRAYYEVHIRKHVGPTLGATQLAKIKAPNVEACLAAIESIRSREGAYEALRSMFKLALRRRLVREDPMATIRKPKAPRRKVEPWTAEESRRFLETARSTPYFALFATGLGTGLRRGELFALRPRDVDLDAGTVRVGRAVVEVEGKLTIAEPNTKRSCRTVRLPGFAVEALREAVANIDDPEALLFADSDGGPLRGSNFVRRVIDPLIKQAKVPRRTLHGVRHASASLLLDAGESIKLISERLGHADERITMQVYAHLMPEADGRAASKLDAVLAPRAAGQSRRPKRKVA